MSVYPDPDKISGPEGILLRSSAVGYWHGEGIGGASEPVEPEDRDDPSSPLRIPVPLVARVRIPTGLVFDVLRVLNEAMTRYEAIFGEIRRPETR